MQSETIKAIYRNGIFIPQVPCTYINNSEIELIIQPSPAQKIEIIDPETRQEILHSLLRRMRQTSLNVYVRRLPNP